MNEKSDMPTAVTPADATRQFEVRSVTGACYTLVEEAAEDTAGGAARRRFRTAYANLPVIANEDGSFTLVETHTRLVRTATP